MAKTLRDYQLEAISRMTDAFVSGATNTFRFRMATGTGKTVTAAHSIETGLGGHFDLTGKRVLVLCHTNNLAAQFRDAVYGEFPRPAAKWEFRTYQSMRNRKPDGDVFALIVDESHQGGQTEDGSYADVIEKWTPRFVLALSATDCGVNEDLFGPRFGPHAFNFTFREGIAAGVLNNVELITIHTGLEQLLDDGTRVAGDDIAEVVRLDREAGVDLAGAENIDVLERAKITAAIHECIRSETGPVLFYVRNTKLADFGAAEFARLSGKPDEVGVAHSRADEADEELERFRRGLLRVLFTVRMVREGFDFPALDVVFDTCPSVSNDARSLIQGMGRVTRKVDGKGLSRYFVCVSPNANRVDVSRLAEERGYTPEETESFAADVALRAGVAEAVEQEGCEAAVDVNETSVPVAGDAEVYFVDAPVQADPILDYLEAQVKKPRMRVSVTRGPLVVKAEGSREAGRVTLAELLNQKSHGYWTYERCLAEARKWDSPYKWRKGNTSSYSPAQKAGWLQTIRSELSWGTPSMRRPAGTWNRAACLAEAAKWGSRSRWGKGSPNSYDAARRKGWCAYIYATLGWPSGGAARRRPVRCKETGRIFSSVHAAARELNLKSPGVFNVLSGKHKSAGGFTFEYVEEDKKEGAQ